MAQRLALERGLDLVVVDYLQLVSGPSLREPHSGSDRDQPRAEETREELDVLVIAASQLNREVEKRAGNRRPKLSDLRESGSIEQDSDLVLFISREGTDNGAADGCTAEISIGKQKNGMTSSLKQAFQRQYTRFANLCTSEDGAAKPWSAEP